jgi:hypothetical protein
VSGFLSSLGLGGFANGLHRCCRAASADGAQQFGEVVALLIRQARRLRKEAFDVCDGLFRFELLLGVVGLRRTGTVVAHSQRMAGFRGSGLDTADSWGAFYTPPDSSNAS